MLQSDWLNYHTLSVTRLKKLELLEQQTTAEHAYTSRIEITGRDFRQHCRKSIRSRELMMADPSSCKYSRVSVGERAKAITYISNSLLY